jgi:hypothetical protein
MIVAASSGCVAARGTDTSSGAFPERDIARVAAGVDVPEIETSLGAELGSRFRFRLFSIPSPNNSLILEKLLGIIEVFRIEGWDSARQRSVCHYLIHI